MTAASADRVALVALLGGAFGIAFAPIFVRLSEIGPTATAFYRMLLALPVLAAWMALERRAGPTPRPRRPEAFRLLVLAGLLFAADLAVWHQSILFTTVANATLLANFTPIYVTLAVWLLLGERFSRTFLIGMGLALGGAVVLMGASVRMSWRHLAGDGLALLTAGFYAGYLLTVSRLRSEFSTATIMTWSSGVSAAVLLPLALLAGERILPATTGGWLTLAGLALVSHVAGQGLIAFALAQLPAAFSSVALLLQPVGAATLAWLILSEPLGPLRAAGGVIVLIGIAVARRGSIARRDA